MKRNKNSGNAYRLAGCNDEYSSLGQLSDLGSRTKTIRTYRIADKTHDASLLCIAWPRNRS